MAVPLHARSLAAVMGGLLVLTVRASVIGTLIVPRSGGRLTRLLARLVNAAFRLATRSIADYQGRDRVLARQAAAVLLTFLGVVIVTLQLACLPTLYAAFNRRETEVALLNARAWRCRPGPPRRSRPGCACAPGSSASARWPGRWAVSCPRNQIPVARSA